ncbi:uncharacterized protein FOMMEDRAFT_170068 [Fomitiporia mediterranea MF3/22]|uniref:uncharacterized protein n=1 Tax=Fomitiporia mediterranea (strain MF3/22) TaxID=694068 RepID=UPI0004408B35|nr:uncharacterized protein FOMMEDRAFT_170068 [Fomitiporia mediterranea MF3/22]EJC99979.1 hypothetical protein FOMMEDRAFT_170068 [Fomitiporia mediterranea MF3/22]
MASDLRAPERPSVKVTYTKKRRPSGNDAAAEESEASATEAESTKAPGGLNAVVDIPGKKSGKHIGPLNLPGPEPRAGSKGKLNENDSSPRAPRTPGKNPKPPSTLSAKLSLASKHGFTAPDADIKALPSTPDLSDKEGSSRATRTTEAERRAYLESQPDVAELEPHRVLCRCCNKWLKLSTTQKYALAPWKLHKKSCTAEKPSSKGSRRSMDFEGSLLASGAEDDDASSIAPSISASEMTRASAAGHRLSAAERQRILEEDELSGEVRPDTIYCSGCAKWVKLATRSTYQLKNWITHVQRVHGQSGENPGMGGGVGAPSSRVREAERKLQLVNDALARDFTPSRVTCKVCATDVPLSDTVPYQLDNWLAHKSVCPARTSAVDSPTATRSADLNGDSRPDSVPEISNASLISSKSSAARAPPSRASTDATCVAVDSGSGIASVSSSLAVGRKRGREEDENEEGGTDAVRARTASYITPDIKPSGPWGWLKLPWETFKRGFAEGLGKPGTSPKEGRRSVPLSLAPRPESMTFAHRLLYKPPDACAPPFFFLFQGRAFRAVLIRRICTTQRPEAEPDRGIRAQRVDYSSSSDPDAIFVESVSRRKADKVHFE